MSLNDTILVVDDSLTVRMDIVDAFSAAGLRAVGCDSIAAARALLMSEKVRLVVLDVMLPDGNGVDLAQEIRSMPNGRHIAILLLSSEADVKDRIRGLLIGSDDYVGKPYDRDYIVARARELLQVDAPSVTHTGATVLVIDDSATYRDVLTRALEARGCNVICAASGEEGLRSAALNRPDAVIVDGVLPGIDGATVVRKLRLDAALRQTPCLMLTGSSTDLKSELHALDVGADAFLRKEEEMEVILARVLAVLRAGGEYGHETASLLGPKKILAVDDSMTYLDALTDVLRGEGYDVIAACSGEEALEMLGVQSVDCVLLDLQMPGLGGIETCRRIKESSATRDVPLILLTANENRESMVEGLSMGADDYVLKSCEEEVLKARVRAQLRRKQIEDESRHIRVRLLRKEIEAAEARAARELAETKAQLVEELEKKNCDLEEARKKAQQESQFKSKFLANMSHELRTPLNAIIGFSELLDEEIAGPLSPTQHSYVHDVLHSAQHLLNLINEILDLSKIDAGRVELRREWTPLYAVVNAVQAVVRPLADQRNIRLEVSIAEDLPDIYVDVVRFKQVLFNLVANGIKFTREGGRVMVRGEQEENGIKISVIDTGIGMRPEDLPRLFREFEQIEPVSGAKPEGTGLGLALTKRLVVLHGGSVEVESEQGKGSEFMVRLPFHHAAQTGRGLLQSDEGPAESLVLVIEDDAHAAELIATHLRAGGLSAAFAFSADEALRLALELTPAAITLDVLMPGIGGWAVLEQLKSFSVTASIPVIVVSVVDDPNRGLALGAAQSLVKPVSREALLDALEMNGVAVRRTKENA